MCNGFEPIWTGALRIKVGEKALNRKANKELLGELDELFHAKTAIIHGEKSHRKKILVKGISKPQLDQILQSNANP